MVLAARVFSRAQPLVLLRPLVVLVAALTFSSTPL